MGSKKSSTPAPAKTYSPQEQAQAQLILQQQQQQYEATQAATARQQKLDDEARERRYAEEDRQRTLAETQAKEAKAAEAKTAQTTKNQGKIDTLYGNASKYDDDRLANLGFKDTYGIGNAYQQEVDRWKSTLDPETYSGASFDYSGTFDRIKSETEGRERQKQQQAYSNMTLPGWEKNYFADTADDDILNAILGEQFTAANDQITTAQKRGQVTDGAMSAALSTLGNKKTAANSTLQDLGLGVLGGYRSQLSDLGKQYADRFSNWSLGDSFNTDYAKQGFDSTASGLRDRLGGDIRRAVGDTQLFDTATILGNAGVTAGASNGALAGAFVNKENSTTDDQKRTTGTTGVF